MTQYILPMLIRRTRVSQAHTTTRLAPQGPPAFDEVRGVVWAMDVFAELVSSGGPLSHLRFDGAALAPCISALTAHLPLHGDAAEEAIEQCFVGHAAKLGSAAFTKELCFALEAFARLPYIDAPHRLAAQTAQTLTPRGGLTERASGRQAPALYVLFRAQVMEHFKLDMDGQPLS